MVESLSISNDDLYVSTGDTTVETYLRIFKEIFEHTGDIAHYNMMMDEETDEDRSYFLIRLPIHTKFVGTAQVAEVAPAVKRLLTVLQGEMNRAELRTALGLKDEKHFREHYQQTASNQGLIEMTIPDKPRSRLQKYRLTNLGRKMLAYK